MFNIHQKNKIKIRNPTANESKPNFTVFIFLLINTCNIFNVKG